MARALTPGNNKGLTDPRKTNSRCGRTNPPENHLHDQHVLVVLKLKVAPVLSPSLLSPISMVWRFGLFCEPDQLSHLLICSYTHPSTFHIKQIQIVCQTIMLWHHSNSYLVDY